LAAIKKKRIGIDVQFLKQLLNGEKTKEDYEKEVLKREKNK